ncbi:hypothetical protein GCM10010170_109680 [Dactylosporangium salmoneum]|uniref:Uncharacterized protein n=1 Tax=Dactylosporangium salmoneum TaxID=53361 RepID=A0ABP5V927_9ACTN
MALNDDQADPPRPTQKETSGGLRETEVNEVAVKPTGPGTVTTTTDAACRRKTRRKRPESMAAMVTTQPYPRVPGAASP